HDLARYPGWPGRLHVPGRDRRQPRTAACASPAASKRIARIVSVKLSSLIQEIEFGLIPLLFHLSSPARTPSRREGHSGTNLEGSHSATIDDAESTTSCPHIIGRCAWTAHTNGKTPPRLATYVAVVVCWPGSETARSGRTNE